MQNAAETVLEIDLSALAHNYHYLASRVKASTKILAVVKAFGYGSDAVAVARELSELGIDYFAVAYSSEGEMLRNALIEMPILVLHPLPVNFSSIVDRFLEPSIYSLKMLREFIVYAENHSLDKYPIHLKFNTGLNRLGFMPKDVDTIIHILAKTNSVGVKSAFSHLAATEDFAEREFTLEQIKSFHLISEELIARLGYRPLMHILNTSGIINYPEAQLDMVRTGIGLYGFGNDPEINKHLIPIATLKTVISQIHHIKIGDSVGYNRAYIAQKPMKTATLPIGHADGIPRSYGKGKGYVTIQSKKAAIVGNVCMDMIMVDVSQIDCEEGDEVIVFGPQASASELSAAISSIPYELITAISQRVRRVILKK